MKIVVVGAGAAGAAASWQLARAGHEVVCVEAGTWSRGSDVGSSFVDWEEQRGSVRNHIPAVRNLQADYPIDDSLSPIKVANYNGVGGSTILFSGHFPRFLRRDLSIRTLDGIGRDWPISYDNLVPFYELNEGMMHVSGTVGDPNFPEIKQLRPPVRLGETGRLVQGAFRNLGWHSNTSFAAINTSHSTQLGTCENLGPCNVGCPRGAKASADIVYMAPAIELGARLVTNASVVSVEVRGKHATGVLLADRDGTLRKEDADIVVMAASAVGTPRVLLNSVSSKFPDGLGNNNDQLGRNLMMHPMALAEALFPYELDTEKGPQGCMVFSLEFHRIPDKGLDLGYMLHVLRGENPILSAKASLRQRKLTFGENLPLTFLARYKKTLGMTAVIEDLPEPSNRVQIDRASSDLFGNPGVTVRYRLSANSKKLLSHGLRSAKSVLTAAGAREVNGFAPVSDTGWHTMGTARMGMNSKDSVVDDCGRIHGVDNVYIVDSSIFPSSSSVNPANTVQAVALYLAEKIAKIG